MARTRGRAINESIDELDQLRQYYKGKPAARRLLFLYMLKIDAKSTISSASEKVGISERRGRYWWDSYRKSGLQGLLQRRGWGQEALIELEKSEDYSSRNQTSQSDGATSGSDPAIALINDLSSIVLQSEDNVVVDEVKKRLLSFLPEVDYVVANVRYGLDLHGQKVGAVHVLRQHLSDSGPVANVSSSNRDYLHTYKQLIEEGRQRGFPFDRYHYPPHGVDFYLESGRRERSKSDEDDTYIGSLLLFRAIGEKPMSSTTIDFVERLRPFLSFLFAYIIAKQQLSQPGGDSMSKIVQRIGSDADLTLREQRVLSLVFNGSSYAEIAELLHLSPNTIQSHVKNIYSKTKVNKMGELFAKYLTPVYFEEKLEE